MRRLRHSGTEIPIWVNKFALFLIFNIPFLMSTEHSMTSIKTTSVTLLLWSSNFTGAPNENIVQNHLNISTVKRDLNG